MSDWHNEPITSTGFDAQIKHETGYELHFYTDRLEAYRAVEKVCQNQLDRKPKTRGDKLRAMTDEELAMFIKDIVVTEFRHHGLIGIFESDDYWLDWFKQEATDNV